MNPLHEQIRALPAGIEFLIVVSWAFGLPIFHSILSIGDADLPAVEFTNAGLIAILIVEMLQSLFLIWFLRIRGWTLEKLGLGVTLRGTLYGIGLIIVVYATLRGVQQLGQSILPGEFAAAAARYPAASPNLSMHLVFLVSTVNGIFEEVFVAGYIITALTSVRGMWTGINVSTGIRLLYHLYQGPLGILSVVPVGLLFGYVYARTRQLWPLILAHIVIDIISLLQGASGHSP